MPTEKQIKARARRIAQTAQRQVFPEYWMDNLTGLDAELVPLARAYMGLPPEREEPGPRPYHIPECPPRQGQPSDLDLHVHHAHRVRVEVSGTQLRVPYDHPGDKADASGNVATVREHRSGRVHAQRKHRSHFPDIEETGPACRLVSSFGNANRRAPIPGGITRSTPKEQVK